MKTKSIFILLGPSCAGKTTIINKLTNETDLVELISHTTRNKRAGEQEGVTYYYIDEEEFKKLAKVEYAEYDDNQYCLSQKELKDGFTTSDKVGVIMERNGVEQLFDNQILKKLSQDKEYNILVNPIFIYADPTDVWQRLKAREESDQAVNRMIKALDDDEFNNEDIAKVYIDNSDGNLENNLNMLKQYINNFHSFNDHICRYQNGKYILNN